MYKLCFFLFLVCSQTIFVMGDTIDVQSGVEAYKEALRTDDFQKKNQLLNKALEIYVSQIEKNPSGELFSNIGDVFTAFGMYGDAVAYYQRACRLLPRNEFVRAKLDQVLHIAAVEKEYISEPIISFLLFRFFSPSERGYIAFGLLAITVILSSLAIWLTGYGFFYPALMAVFVTTGYLGLWSIGTLLVRPKGIVLSTVPVYLDEKGTESTGSILSPGQMVFVTFVQNEGNVLGVETKFHIKGYVKRENIMTFID